MDEYLISTDVDTIIAVLTDAADRGMDIRELASACGKSLKDTKKWVHVLEEQGSVRVEHKLTREHVYWAGGKAGKGERQAGIGVEGAIDIARPVTTVKIQDIAASFEEEETPEKERGIAIEEVEELLKEKREMAGQIEADEEQAQSEEVVKKVEQELLAHRVAEEEARRKVEEMRVKEEEERAEREAARKEEEAKIAEENADISKKGGREGKEAEVSNENSGKSQKEIELRENVEQLERLERDISGRLEGIERAIEERIRQQEEMEREAEREGGLQKRMQEAGSTGKKRKEEGVERAKRLDAGVARFSGKFGEHVSEVNKIAEEIEKLNLERQKLMREVYAPLEKKFETEMEVVATKLLNKEKEIMGLRQRAADIPNFVGEFGQKHEKMVEIEGQMKRIVDESCAMMEEARSQISEAISEVEEGSEEVRRSINSQYVRLEELKGASQQIDGTRQKIGGMLAQVRAELEAEAVRVGKLEKGFEHLNQIGEDVKARMGAIKGGITRQQTALENMREQLNQLREVDRWASENELEYKKNMGQLSDFVKNNDVEYLQLREEIEANFVRRYLRELRGITESYEYELGEAAGIEAKIDQKIATAKERMEEMIAEGKKMAYLYELQLKEEAKEAFDTQRQKRERMFRALSASAGKKNELDRMIEQIIGREMQVEVQQVKGEGKEERAAPVKRKLAKAGKKAKKRKGRR